MKIPNTSTLTGILFLLVTLWLMTESSKSAIERSAADFESMSSSIGKLTAAGVGCTAVAISPDQVVTAAHCIFSRRTSRFLQPGSLHYLLGQRGDYEVNAVASSYQTGRRYDPTRPVDTSSEDWAVIRLQQSLPSEYRAIQLAAHMPEPGTVVATGGYSQDRPFVITVDRDCRILQNIGALLIHNCRSVPGYSGAPLIESGSGSSSMEIIGVNIGHGYFKTERVNFAIAANVIRQELNDQ
jgi:protease YdgD